MLATGISISCVLYVFAGSEDNSAMTEIYSSKSYVRTLQRFGGKASVLFDEFMRWFSGLWEGKTLPLTVLVLSACIAAILALCGRYLARN